MKAALILFGWFGVVLLVLGLLCVGGCAPKSAAYEQAAGANAATGRDLASTGAYLEAARGQTDSLGQYVAEAGKSLHKGVLGLLDKAIDAKAASEADNAKQLTKINLLEGERKGWQDKCTSLEAKWYVVWGRRLEFFFWLVLIGWLVCGLAGMFMTAFSGGAGVWFAVGKFLLSMLPFANLFSFGSRTLEGWRSQPT